MSAALSSYASALRARLGAGGSRQFAIVSALAFSAIVAIAGYSLLAIHRELTESALSRRASQSDLTAATLSEKFNRATDVAVSLATRVRFRDLIEAGEWATAARILRDAPADFAFIERIGLIDAHGALLAGVPEVPAPGRQNFAERDWFQAALRGKPQISDIFKRAAAPQANVFLAAVPIRSSGGATLGVLVVQMTVARFFEWIAAVDVGEAALIFVVDRRGTLAFHPKLSLQGDLVDFSDVPVVRQLRQGMRGVERSFNPVEQEERISAYSPVPGHGWGVVVAEPSATVFAGRNRLLGLALVAYLLILAFFAAFIANRLALQRGRAEAERRAVAERERLAQQSLARHEERLRIVHEIDRAILAGAKADAIAAAVLQPLRRLLSARRLNINMIDYAAGELEWLAAAGRRRTHVGSGVRFPMHMIGDLDALRRGEAQTIDTGRLPPSPQRELLLAAGVRHYMAVPMIAGGELIGALSFGGEDASFPQDQVTMVQEVATQLAVAIGQARLFEQSKRSAEALARQAERLRIVHEIDRALIGEVDLQALAAAVLQPLRELLGVPRVVVNLFDLAAGEVEWLAAAGRRRMHVGPGVRYPLSFMGDLEALKRGEPQVIDTHALPPGPATEALLASGVRVYMAVPMIAGGELIGALSFGGELAEFPAEQVTIAREVATQLAIAITQARLFERVRRHGEELEERVRERTAQLEVANKELESFSYSVSHDLRAPLRAVDGYALMLTEDYGARLDDEGRRLLGVVRASAEQMGRLIDDLLKFSQIGRRTLAKAPVDMRGLAGEVVAELAPAYPKARIELGALPAVVGDRALLRQVWSNLIGNALKYSAQTGAPSVRISGRADGAEITYSVSDNGAGFEMRYYEKLFNVFQRLHRQDEFEGTGVGLAIVQRVVLRHGGRVWAEGAVGKGATFHFAVPRES